MIRPSTLVKIPKDRIGVLIGPDGFVKESIENRLFVELQIESETGNVKITLNPSAEDPSFLFRSKELVTAVGRGFSPERAFRLLEEDNAVLTIIDLRQITGKSKSDINRLKGRVIGKAGKTRKIIEELTETNVSVYGHTVSIIGNLELAQIADEAIRMLIRGSQHRTVYNYLHNKRREIKKRRTTLWETIISGRKE